jgi:hypothetical protein
VHQKAVGACDASNHVNDVRGGGPEPVFSPVRALRCRTKLRIGRIQSTS